MLTSSNEVMVVRLWRRGAVIESIASSFRVTGVSVSVVAIVISLTTYRFPSEQSSALNPSVDLVSDAL